MVLVTVPLVHSEHLRTSTLLSVRLACTISLFSTTAPTARNASPPAPLPRAQEPDADENKLLPIIAIGGGGTLLSTVFFAENLKRLGTKVASGGKDDGYTKSSNQRRR